jgi:hypothetical protein
MPTCIETSAPSFDPKQPRELSCYFNELDLLFTKCGITDNEEKKRYSVRYLNFELHDIWSQIAEFAPGGVYVDFVKGIYRLYLGAEQEHKYLITDMDKLVGEWLRLGINTITELGKYHWSFLTITNFLITKNHLDKIQQSRTFI